MKNVLAATLVGLALSTSLTAQPPEYIWYDFNGGNATNTANPGVGNGIPSPTLVWPSALCGNDTACQSPAMSLSTHVDTGWALSLGAGDWTVGMWLDLTSTAALLNNFQYLFGDSGLSFFHCQVAGSAGTGNILLGGPFTDVVITGGGSQTAPVHICWVYDSSLPAIRGYVNGVLNVTVPQAPLNINHTSNFMVMRAGGSSLSARPGVIIDDFRFYGRAIDLVGTGPGTELAMWVGNCASGPPPPPSYQVNQPSCSLDVNAVLSNGFLPAVSVVPVGTTAILTMDSTAPGLPFDMVIDSSPLIPNALPLGSQILNLNLFSPTVIFVNGLNFTTPHPGFVTIPVIPPTPLILAAQCVILDGTGPLGLALSQAVQINAPGSQVSTFSGDDDHQVFNLANPIVFYGQVFSSVAVSTNGWIKFGSSVTHDDASPSANDFVNGTMGGITQAPGIAVLWADLNMANRPTSMVQVTEDYVGNTLQVDWIDGDYFWPTITFGNVTCIIDTSGSTGVPVRVTLDYTAYVATSPPSDGITGVSAGDPTLAIATALNIASAGAVTPYTSLFPVETLFQNFDGTGSVVPPVPVELFDLGGLIVTFHDATANGQFSMN